MSKRTSPVPPAEEAPLIPLWDDDGPCAGRMLGIRRSTTYTLAARGSFPVEIIKHGRQFQVRTADVRRYLGLALDTPA